MMKITFNKKVAGILLFVWMLLVAGCSESTDTGNDNSSTDNETDEAAETIKIGFILSQTGTFAPLSEGIINGFNLYLDENDGMLGGKEVEIKVEDDEANPQVALRKYRQLVQSEKVDLLVGPISTSVVYALRDEVEKDKIILIDANAAGDDLAWSEKSDYVYRTSFSNWQNGSSTAEYLANNIGKRAIVLAPDYPAGEENIRAFKAAFEAAGGEVIKEFYPQLDTNDFSPYLQEASAEKPDLIYAFFTGSDGIRFVSQYKELGLQGKIPLGGPFELGDELVTEPAGDAAEGIITGIIYSPYLDNELNKKFVEAYEQKYSKLPNFFAVEGYDSAAILDKAILDAGSTEAEELMEVLKGISIESPRGPLTIDPKTNNPIQNFYIAENKYENDAIIPEVIETVEDITMPETSPFE